MCLRGIMSLSGNSLLLLVAHHKRPLLKPAEFFIVNLAVSDLSMTVTLFPLASSSLFAHRRICSSTGSTESAKRRRFPQPEQHASLVCFPS
ncbi:hypothetical protein DUI87_28038 [Hirundo rustica rustica]|uniref:G-protein coupled receptors family 1 profile domain-containing protein n=1 Tax=Hirundo rustica rustica TaxID=333673 RepID=A0A3M0J4T0_HIRRU|nr:hypothetical protein DUI87_28038 [Hirundo rustica rustica]